MKSTFAVVVLLVLAVLAWQLNGELGTSADPEIAGTEVLSAPEKDQPATPASGKTTATRQHSRGDGRTTTVPRRDLRGIDSRLVALSMEEARWLERHGYPTADEIRKLESYSEPALLEAARERGISKAAVLLGLKRMSSGDESGALAAFSLGASRGSLYARQALALTHLRRARSYPGGAADDHRAVAIAGLEVTRMLGDHRAGGLIDEIGAGLDRRFYGETIRQQMVEFMRQYADDFSSRGKQAPGPDPRPNSELWAQIDAGVDANGTITIIDRGGG